jgi:hypothetical protein
MAPLSNANLVKGLELFNITSLIFIAGVSSSMSFLSIPLIMKSPTLKGMTIQFHDMVTKGFKYLQPGSRTITISLAALTYTLHQNTDRSTALRWKYWFTSFAILAQLAWYEIVKIFPINDRIAEIGNVLEQAGEDEGDKEKRMELIELLRKWQRRNLVRAFGPLIAALIGLSSLLWSS